MNRMHIAASFAGLIRTLQKPKGGNSTISSVRHLKHLRTWKNLWSLDSLGLPENRFSTKLSKMVIPSGHASHFQTHPDVHVDSMVTLSQHPRLSSTTLWPTWPWTTVVPAFSRATTCSLFPLWKVTDFFPSYMETHTDHTLPEQWWSGKSLRELPYSGNWSSGRIRMVAMPRKCRNMSNVNELSHTVAFDSGMIAKSKIWTRWWRFLTAWITAVVVELTFGSAPCGLDEASLICCGSCLLSSPPMEQPTWNAQAELSCTNCCRISRPEQSSTFAFCTFVILCALFITFFQTT